MSASSRAVARFVTVAMGLVVGLTFLFGFGNVSNLALKSQIPVFVAPLVAPAVDLTVLGLLVGTRHLALAGASDEVLRPARRLLLAASVVTLLLNVADPVFAGEWGKAAFDAVGPLLVIGWAETGPGLLRALSAVSTDVGVGRRPSLDAADSGGHDAAPCLTPRGCDRVEELAVRTERLDVDLVERARQADADHWRRYRRPISAETLRKQLRVGARRSRELVSVIRLGSEPSRGRTDDPIVEPA